MQIKEIENNIFELKSSNKVNIRLFLDKKLLDALESTVFQQLLNIAELPGVISPVCAMPDTHSGYGFPIGGVAAFDAEEGVISAGGVGFDIACGVRTLLTPLSLRDILPIQEDLADELFQRVPAGVGSKGDIKLSFKEVDKMLVGGARWAIEQGFGEEIDLQFIEDDGVAKEANPDFVSKKAKERQKYEMGTLGAGNHYLEVQVVEEIFDLEKAKIFGLSLNQIVVSIHCGSRGLGHQVATEYMQEMVKYTQKRKLSLPDKNLAYAPIKSELGRRYFSAMQAAINCALANRQIITHLVRSAFNKFFKGIFLALLYDVSHNTCRKEVYEVKGKLKELYVHRKGATRSFGPRNKFIPFKYQKAGQPVLIGGSMGTFSYILAGGDNSDKLSFGSTCHGAGRVMSRNQAKKTYSGKNLISKLNKAGIVVRGHSYKGLAEEAPSAYKDVSRVVEVTHNLGLSTKVARLRPLIVIKG
ncbi:tRNA-splicing ligase RtcB [Desulfonauticus submarinus]|uniref:tRNA-splicing ligase RtcB n=1 Tax=Desulfonauticus submarinus TaxID=206665 RepID=A0A1H0BWJ9_9BACT|nr:RtcB family protein [Desulfonauticus submarinus]SDN50004.1 tRNA-splicing ligase RtcB [Desulfonauticus submarinus]